MAQVLPPHILIQVFFEAVRSQDFDDGISTTTASSTLPVEEPMHGGRLVGWDSNEFIKNMPLVCRAWQDSAQFVLYRSVAILSATASELFLRTASTSPHLLHRTISLVLGLGKHREDTEAGESHLVESFKVIQVLPSCPNLRHLQIRPLHPSVRLPLIDSLRSIELISFACLARLGGMQWSQGIFQPSDLPALLKPSLRQLELDFDFGSQSWANQITPPIFHQGLRLVSLRLHVDFPPNFLLSLINMTASTLEVLDVYLEAPLHDHHQLSSLISSAQTLRSLSIVINPSFDTHLTHFPAPNNRPFSLAQLNQLELLRLSSVDISLEQLPHLPQSLRFLCVHVLSGARWITTPEVAINTIRQMPLASLKVLCIHDIIDNWNQDDISAIRSACVARGIGLRLSDLSICELSIW